VTENDDLAIISFYPNPASDWVMIEHVSLVKMSVTIFDILVNVILKIEVSSTNQIIDISMLGNGMYIVAITGDDWTTQRKIIVE